jgi:hypothetical protein
MASSFVEWDGLTKLILDMDQNVPQQTRAVKLAGMTRELGEDMLQLYRDNLEGSEPSTDDANPLPVGYAERRPARRRDPCLSPTNTRSACTTTHRGQGWIEDGTVKMAPRLAAGKRRR